MIIGRAGSGDSGRRPQTAAMVGAGEIFEDDEGVTKGAVVAPGPCEAFSDEGGIHAEAVVCIDITQEPAIAVSFAGIGEQESAGADQLARAGGGLGEAGVTTLGRIDAVE